ncbi:conserved membrane protein of unknown function [Tenacibaculum sp. 190524A02b]|uniref:hypothetical protein n=1 Tax=Tenacibaculum vairaonense TaxID=3137860 RepID=UPI0032B1EC23
MKFFVNKSKLTFLLLSLIGGVIAMMGFFFLPERFFFDTETILFDKYNEIGWVGSYPFTILFYRLTGIGNLHFSIIGLFQYSIVTYLTYRIGVPKKFDIITAKNIITYLSFVMVAVFLCMPTKEFINYIYLSMVVLILKNQKFRFKKTVFLVLLLLVFFGVFFREYYILIAFLSLIFWAVSKINIKNKRIATIAYGLITAICISLSYGIIKGQFISNKTRESYNLSRINGEASNSMIMSPIDTEYWYGESFGIIYGFFSVNLPVNGLKHIFSPQILAFILWQLLIFIILFIRYERCLKKGVFNNQEIWIFYILFSFFIVQGVFEPDLGSAIRHKMGFFPIIYFALYYDKFQN